MVPLTRDVVTKASPSWAMSFNDCQAYIKELRQIYDEKLRDAAHAAAEKPPPPSTAALPHPTRRHGAPRGPEAAAGSSPRHQPNLMTVASTQQPGATTEPQPGAQPAEARPQPPHLPASEGRAAPRRQRRGTLTPAAAAAAPPIAGLTT